jgi:uncharacterized protein (TIGR02996 family)
VSTDERGLLDAIRDDPDDDAARLVYADWLEENGRADHAELIRVQIAQARRRGDWEALKRREDAALAALNAAWPGRREAGVYYRRGMGLAVWEKLDGFDAWAASELPPWVVERELTLNGRAFSDADLRGLAASEHLARLTRLTIRWGDRLTSATVGALAGSPHAANLHELSLQMSVGEKGAAALAGSKSLARLRRLVLTGGKLNEKAVARLVGSPALAGLRCLTLIDSFEGDAPVRVLAAATGLPRLRVLELHDNGIGDARLRLLLPSPLLARLEGLALIGNPIRDGGAKALAACEALSGLKRLNLDGTQLSDAGVQALLDSPHLANLEQLDLHWQKKVSEPMLDRVRERLSERQK